MRITIETIPHDQQRYTTAADWWFDDAENLQIRVSRMKNWRYEALCAIHELTEALLCRNERIEEMGITEFDKAFEAARDAVAPGVAYFRFHSNDYTLEAEPGDALTAPYRTQHCFATAVERMLCAAFGTPWESYDEAVLALFDD